jgi:hypothetical protein
MTFVASSKVSSSSFANFVASCETSSARGSVVPVFSQARYASMNFALNQSESTIGRMESSKVACGRPRRRVLEVELGHMLLHLLLVADLSDRDAELPDDVGDLQPDRERCFSTLRVASPGFRAAKTAACDMVRFIAPARTSRSSASGTRWVHSPSSSRRCSFLPRNR